MIRVTIDARLVPGMQGGVEPVLQGLAHGLSRIEGPDRFAFLTYTGASAWLEPFVSGPCSILPCGPPPEGVRADRLPAWLHPVVPLAKRLRRLWRPMSAEIPGEPPAVAAFKADVVHLALQSGFATGRPSVFHPHDLQHVHFPTNFTPDDLAKRTYVYRTLARNARTVVALSAWGATDIASHLDVPAERIEVVPWAVPPTVANAAWETDAAERIGMTGPFALFPAQTWPHKNHRNLIQAWSLLDYGQAGRLHLVCTGRLTAAGGELEGLVRSLGLSERIHFTGHIPATRLAGLLRRADMLVYPSRFEGWGLPLAEAFSVGTPVACSSSTCLPEVAGGAAQLFDPEDPVAIAEAVRRLHEDVALRAELIARGRTRATAWSWDSTAAAMLAIYRRASGAIG